MARRARRESSTGMYHVMVRGLNKLPVFQQKREKTRILNLIRENLSKYEVAIYAYCIMSNHFHLLIQADIKELAAFMAKILAAYAHYYNYKHNKVGYVFQDRFKSECVETSGYFWNCLRYIHRNPCSDNNVENVLKSNCNSLREFYYQKQDIIADQAFDMVNDRFETRENLLKFHQRDSRDVFCDVEEDIIRNHMCIARDILEEINCQTDIPKLEFLEYIKTRELFRKTLMTTLKVSRNTADGIMQLLRTELMGTG